jgi:hypothetical protein
MGTTPPQAALPIIIDRSFPGLYLAGKRIIYAVCTHALKEKYEASGQLPHMSLLTKRCFVPRFKKQALQYVLG